MLRIFSATIHEREQLNNLTSFIDGSLVYGSTDDRANLLRSHIRGQLAVSDDNLLPTAPHRQKCDIPVHGHPDKRCFNAGKRQHRQILLGEWSASILWLTRLSGVIDWGVGWRWRGRSCASDRTGPSETLSSSLIHSLSLRGQTIKCVGGTNRAAPRLCTTPQQNRCRLLQQAQVTAAVLERQGAGWESLPGDKASRRGAATGKRWEATLNRADAANTVRTATSVLVCDRWSPTGSTYLQCWGKPRWRNTG